MKFILGKKLGMSQVFDERKKVVPVTLVEAGPCFVVQSKTKEKDGYQAVQLGFEEIRDNRVKKPQRGHFKKSGLEKSFRYLSEFADSNLKAGDKIDVSIFQEGEIVKVSSLAKGRGFQGVVKRHGFSGFPASHGTKHGLRAPGSIGSAWPERVLPGRKMAGRMGTRRVTISGLKIVQVDKENNLLAVQGAVPGRKNSLLEIRVSKEIKAVEKEKEDKLIVELEEEERKVQEKKGQGKIKEPEKEKEEKTENK